MTLISGNKKNKKVLKPKGIVDNNLGPDRLAGPKALNQNYCIQPTLRILCVSPNCA